MSTNPNTNTISLPNPALCVSGINKLEILPYRLSLDALNGKPVVPAGQVLVRVRATGICGSDIHFWKHGSAGPDIFSSAFVLGHECAGEIADVGAGVGQHWKRGDRIAIKPALPCRTCDDCTTGQANLCAVIRHFGVPGCDGGACRWKLVREEQLVRLTARIGWVEAGVVQPLAITVQMGRQAGLGAGMSVLVLGGGCIGLLVGAVARASGARMVVVLEKERHRAEFAKRYCADRVFVSPERSSPEEETEAYAERVAKHVLENVNGLHRGFDVCVEASGKEECMQIGIKVCRPGGTYVQVGNYAGKHPRIPMVDITSKQLNVRGTWRYTTNCFEEAISMIERGLVDVKSLVSHVYGFDESLEAFEAVYKMKDRSGKGVMKVVILHDGENDIKNGNAQASL